MDLYSLSRQWFDWSFENPDLIKPSHTALYFFCIEHCNRLGWKEKFGLPTTMAKDAIGIKSYNTYIDTLKDLVSWGFIKLIQKSSNQYSSNIIAISKNIKAHTKALDKALIKHGSKQSESTVQSIDSIDIQDTSIQIYNSVLLPKPKTPKSLVLKKDFEERKNDFINLLSEFKDKYTSSLLNDFFGYWSEKNVKSDTMRYEDQKYFEISKRLITWKRNADKNEKN